MFEKCDWHNMKHPGNGSCQNTVYSRPFHYPIKTVKKKKRKRFVFKEKNV